MSKESPFEVACKEGNLEQLKEIIHTTPLIELDLHNFSVACYFGHLELVQYMMESRKLNLKIDQYAVAAGFSQACIKDQVHIVKYFVESPDLQTHFNIYSGDSEGFRRAYRYSGVETVKYLLSPHLEHNFIESMQFFVNEAFHEACKNGDLELVKIYTNHPQIAPHLDMDKVYNDSFHWACIKHQKHVIDYLILEKNYPQTKFIEDLIKGASNFLNDDKGIALRQYIDKLFNYKQLNDELPEKSVTKNKRKI